MASELDVEDFLEHFGVRGMHWGQRKAERGGVSRAVDRQAHKDAKEHARAKMFYGEGAGTRRKLINKSIEARKAHDPSYAKAFDRHLKGQDLSVHATKAVKERTRTDRTDRNKKRIGAVARRLTGEFGTQAAFVALAATGAAFFNSDKGRRFLNNGVSKIKNTQSDFARRQGAKHISDMLKNMK